LSPNRRKRVPPGSRPIFERGAPKSMASEASTAHPVGAPRGRYSSTQAYRPLRRPETVEDRDACALYAAIRRDGRAGHEVIGNAFVALQKMLHRAGNVDGEGDGCGVMVDLPRAVWAEEVRRGGHAPSLTLDPAFAVGHVFVPRKQSLERVRRKARKILNRGGFRVLAERRDAVDSSALGPTAREDEPHFWQVAGLVSDASVRDRALFDLAIEIERELELQVASFSAESCVYKVMGAPKVLQRYFEDLRDPRAETVAVLGHNRYSTNTWPTFARVQPFSVLGHNGEINTIARLRSEAQMLGVPLRDDSSDSQDLNRAIETLIARRGLSLAEAMELAVPPIVHEIRQFPEELRGFYMYLRQAMGPFAQGPIALIARHGDELVFSADALGLRPLWQIEAHDTFVFTSEPGVVSLADMTDEPKPLAPGEKVMVRIDRGRGARLHDHQEVQRIVCDRWLERTGAERVAGFEAALPTGGPLEGPEIPGYMSAGPWQPVKVEEHVLGGFGWQREDTKLVQQMASNGAEPIGSLGYDGPLAALSPERQNLADYFKETVAVVTNPAIDREREIEHFSCRAVFGARPSIDEPHMESRTIETAFPIILGGHHDVAPISDEDYREVAREHKTYLLEDLWEAFKGWAGVIDISLLDAETTEGALERLKHEATKMVLGGVELLVLSDRTAFEGERPFLDPHLALSAIDRALREYYVGVDGPNLRRRTSIVLRSGAIRNVHDVCMALGLGADGVCPYVMVEVICVDDYKTDISNLCSALRKGIEKVISTLGIHEVRGYARLFSAIGLKPELVEIFGTPGYYGSDEAGTGFAELDLDTARRQRILAGEEDEKPGKTFRFYPKVYKAAIAASNGAASFDEYSVKVRELEQEHPISMRHIMDLRFDRPAIDPSLVDPGVGHHSYPIVISSMSFGSQGEVAFRAYPEAAMRTNIVCINGEGGEIRDMYGKYPKWRGQQVASGRFGVTSEMLNSSYLVEIKIGQGAKPGEGGHLPAKKVSEKVAAARNATPGTDLISPSNNHDLYSIEDLAELIDELKTANPDVRVSVKVPVVPNIGTIGVGIAKAGADIITLSGFEGGTGAARQHALRHVGLPSDIGTRAVHLALLEAGIRNRVEIWADGGYRHGYDIVKLHCLGANRVAFGTLAMVSLGCTICRGCQLDTCHVGIATQIDTMAEAEAKGLKKFTPQEFEQAAESCARFFKGMGEEVRRLVAEMGYERAQDLVGRSDLLVQAREKGAIDLTEMIRPLEEMLDLEPIDMPVSAEEEREEAGLIVARPIRMEEKKASKELAAFAADVCGGPVNVSSTPAPRSEGAGDGASGDGSTGAVGLADGGGSEGGAPGAPGDGRGVAVEYPRPVDANDRVLGTELAGALSRARIYRPDTAPKATMDTLADLHFDGGSIGGSGLGAFNVWGVDIRVEGGAQDGVGKTMFGGTIAVLKGRNRAGRRVNGSVGKSFAYGAQRGRFFVQGSADSRFCIRLSGADVVIAGEPEGPIQDELGGIADRANIKGFAFEYMTSGRAVVLGDIGPWACSGQTGGRVYMRVNEQWGLDRAALERRLGTGAKVSLLELDDEGVNDVQELLGRYAEQLERTDQPEEAERVGAIARKAREHFLMSVPQGEQTDPSVSTE
jgi:glutamate synthase (NADPH/NADH) large chain